LEELKVTNITFMRVDVPVGIQTGDFPKMPSYQKGYCLSQEWREIKNFEKDDIDCPKERQ
jgi:hypothetical protein